MKKVLQINSVVGFGSTGRIVEMIGLEAIRNGYLSFLAYGRESFFNSKSTNIKIGNKIDVYRHIFFTRILDRHGLSSINVTKEFIKKIDKISPDIVHLHNIHGYYLNYEVLFEYLSIANVPVIWTMHDCWPITGHCAYFSFIQCEKWKTNCFNCPQKQYYPASLCLDRSYKNHIQKLNAFTQVQNMIIVSVSNWLAAIMRESFFSKYEIKIINNGVDIDVFQPKQDKNRVKEKYLIRNDRMLMGVASTWDERKGLNDYCKLRSLLPDEYDIVLVGLSKKQINNLPEGIIGIERTWDRIELASLYSAADIVLNLSKEETFGLTTVEGFACGTPSIVYNATASPELINSRLGEVVEFGDLNQLLSAMNKILQNGKEYYSLNCRQWAVSYYNMKDKWKQYIELYNKLIN
jgi:glycosyltransferase involved in cell wall biosynthesis